MWLFITVFAYFINAGVYIADKFLLSKKIHSSIAYAFYVGIWSIFNVCLLFFWPWMPNLRELALDLLAGFLFLVTLVFWYKALHQSEASRVVPIVGALVPIFSFILSFIFLGETLNQRQLIAFIVLICGGVLISIKHTKVYLYKKVITRLREVVGDIFGDVPAGAQPTSRLLVNSVAAAAFFAGYYVLMKYIYLNQPFIGSFVYSRLGSFVGVILMLFISEWRYVIFTQQKDVKTPKNLFYFLTIRLFAAAAFIMINWAISLGNVAIVNALQGVQYLFLFIIIILISNKFPKMLNEQLGRGVFIQKLIGTIMVCLGLYLFIV
ncbi:EamA family transporter [Patescibacteria group bacterium]|nr:EamA family transporter [Patescibacteria group bacterium]MBU1663686.1 EamA family transporter [Patescibacteria group bacterium]MBU1934323.1 EamA family transporter [Patescibacteria group bacterium]MBU2007741.1 EamA family transporter [Patescibacteria group bacterium]MBU2233635.1 EamA family transporter [Patescibacteria group bacterium]